MSGGQDSRLAEDAGPALWRGVLGILVAGALLGVAYNALGLLSRPAWGLSWIAEDPMAQLAEMPSIGAAPQPSSGGGLPPVSDDPLAVPGTAPRAAGLPEIPRIGRPVQIELGALKQYVDAGAALIADARERAEYLAGHIPGAISLPYDEVVSDPVQIDTLQTEGRPIITYCGGGSCEVSLGLAEELFYAGHDRVAVYVGGYPEWVAAGHPVETGAGGESF